MTTFLNPVGGVWVVPTAQTNVVPNAFTIGVIYDPATMSEPAISYADLYAVLKTAYVGTNYPVFPGSQLETLVDLLAGPPYDLAAINAAGCATMSAGTISSTTSLPDSTVLGVARDGYFDFTDALSQYTGASTTLSFRLNAFVPFTVEEQGGCAAVIRGSGYKQMKLNDMGVEYTRSTLGAPLLWSRLTAALKPSNLVAKLAAGTYPTPVDFQAAVSEQGFIAVGYGAASVANVPVFPWGLTIGGYNPVYASTYPATPYTNTGAAVALNPYLADGDFGSSFVRLSCQHSIIQ